MNESAEDLMPFTLQEGTRRESDPQDELASILKYQRMVGRQSAGAPASKRTTPKRQGTGRQVTARPLQFRKRVLADFSPSESSESAGMVPNKGRRTGLKIQQNVQRGSDGMERLSEFWSAEEIEARLSLLSNTSRVSTAGSGSARDGDVDTSRAAESAGELESLNDEEDEEGIDTEAGPADSVSSGGRHSSSTEGRRSSTSHAPRSSSFTPDRSLTDVSCSFIKTHATSVAAALESPGENDLFDGDDSHDASPDASKRLTFADSAEKSRRVATSARDSILRVRDHDDTADSDPIRRKSTVSFAVSPSSRKSQASFAGTPGAPPRPHSEDGGEEEEREEDSRVEEEEGGGFGEVSVEETPMGDGDGGDDDDDEGMAEEEEGEQAEASVSATPEPSVNVNASVDDDGPAPEEEEEEGDGAGAGRAEGEKGRRGVLVDGLERMGRASYGATDSYAAKSSRLSEVFPRPSPPADGERRSRRRRMRPLQYWRNERVEYSRAAAAALPEVTDLLVRSPEPTPWRRKYKRKGEGEEGGEGAEESGTSAKSQTKTVKKRSTSKRAGGAGKKKKGSTGEEEEGEERGKPSEAPPAKKMRKRTPFFEFCTSKRAVVQSEHPDLPISEQAKLLGKMWNELGDAEKQVFVELAAA